MYFYGGKFMKKLLAMFSVALLFGFISCGSNVSVKEDTTRQENVVATGGFAQLKGKVWKLYGLRTAAGNNFSREKLDEASGDFFTLEFTDDMYRGRGAPNTFRGPYTLGEGKNISFGMAAATMMMALFELEELKEYEYFQYLSKVASWALVSDKLELYSTAEDGSEVVLVFLTE